MAKYTGQSDRGDRDRRRARQILQRQRGQGVRPGRRGVRQAPGAGRGRHDAPGGGGLAAAYASSAELKAGGRSPDRCRHFQRRRATSSRLARPSPLRAVRPCRLGLGGRSGAAGAGGHPAGGAEDAVDQAGHRIVDVERFPVEGCSRGRAIRPRRGSRAPRRSGPRPGAAGRRRWRRWSARRRCGRSCGVVAGRNGMRLVARQMRPRCSGGGEFLVRSDQP